MRASHGPTPAATTRTSSSPVVGIGRGTSSMTMISTAIHLHAFPLQYSSYRIQRRCPELQHLVDVLAFPQSTLNTTRISPMHSRLCIGEQRGEYACNVF